MLSLVSLTAHATQNDPDLVGAFGSNKTNANLASPVPGDAGEPWSHYLNPWAHPGVASYLGLTGGAGEGAVTYGETTKDAYPLRPLNGLAKLESYKSRSTKTWTVNGFEYHRRRVTLKSGASLVIFEPTNPPDPDDCSQTNGVYDRDALFVPVGYQGNGFELVKHPRAWASGHTDPYTGSPPFGYEIDLGNFNSTYSDVFWIRQGSVEWEALERGMTLVFVHASLGERPLATHLAQLIEAAHWLDSCRYTGTCNLMPQQRTSYRHRNFIKGASYDGGVARIAATYLPWLFRGAVAIASAVDQHATYGWQPTYEFLQDQVLGRYPGGFVAPYDFVNADILALSADLRRGYTDGQSIAGVPVDVAGAGLFVWDLPSPLLSNPRLIVPLVLVHGDDDQSQYSFFGMDLETGLALGDSSDSSMYPTPFQGTNCMGQPTDYTGVVVERRVPNECHSGIEHWNADQHAVGAGLLDLLMDEVALQPIEPIPFASSNPSGDIEWEVRASGASDPAVARVFRDELLTPKRAELPPAVFGTGFACGDVTEVLSGDWPELGNACEGLGMPNSIVVADLGGDEDVELVAGTGRGDVVKLRFETGGTNVVQSVELVWRRRVSDFTDLDGATDYFGPSEVLLDGNDVVVAHTFGPVWSLDASSDDPSSASLLLGNAAGTWLRSLQKSGDTFSLINDEGELLRFQADGSPLQGQSTVESFLEGGAGPVLPLGGEAYLYGSAHGNLKRSELVGGVPVHPKTVANLSEHLYGLTRLLLVLQNPIGTADYLAWTDHLILFDDAACMPIVGTPQQEPRPDGLLESAGGEFVGFWKKIPAELRVTGDPEDLEIPVVADFAVKWVATLQTGQVALIGGLAGETGDVSGSKLAVFREAFGNTFGMVTTDQANALVGVVGPVGKVWLLDVDAELDADTSIDDVLLGFLPNEFHGGEKNPHGPFRGAVEAIADPEVPSVLGYFGLPDGGEAYPGSHWVAMPFASPFLQDDVDLGVKDPLNFEAGVMVADLGPRSSPGDYVDVQNALLCSTYIGGGLCQGLVAPSVDWKSNPLTSNLMVGSVEDTGFILTGFGNACRWVDLDGDTYLDLAVSTHGGRVVWFENPDLDQSPASVPPNLPQDWTGEAVYVNPRSDLGWDGDLGTTMMAMEVANLDGGADEELLVGTFFDVDPDHPEHYRLGGSVYALDLLGADLVVLDSLELDFGVCGLHRIPYAGAGAQVHFLVAGTARGRIYVLRYDHSPSVGDRLEVVYRSRFFAPMAGAYNAIRSFLLPGTTDRYRIVFGSSGGVFALDIDLPAAFTPDTETPCTGS